MGAGDPVATFALLLRHHRIAAGLTQEGLAERAGLSLRGIQHLERGGTAPHTDTLRRLTNALELGPDDRAVFEASTRPAPRRRTQAPGPTIRPLPILPAPLTQLIGRDHETEQVAGMLATTRLLTLTGTSGCGKTRLALHVASVVAGSYSHGVGYVDLAPLADPSLVLQTVATILGVRELPGTPLMPRLLSLLGSRQLLLILDNCEHLVDSYARAADALLSGCPRLRILATSRRPLAILGETVFRVPSLPFPMTGGPTSTWDGSVAGLLEHAAVQLFVERARSVRPSFTPTEENAAAVARICAQLDGIPLAIELAAARVAGLAVEQIAAHLDQRFQLLVRGSRTALPRHQTLRALVEWSYDLLDKQERLLFDRLSVFAGGFTLEAVEAVCCGTDIDTVDVLELLLNLIDQSLVVADGRGGQERYQLLETLRQYGGEQLRAGGLADAVRRPHAEFYLDLAEQTVPHLAGSLLKIWTDRLNLEQDNLRLALRWYLDQGEGDAGLRLGAALGTFWLQMGRLAEGGAWLIELLSLPSAANRGATRARALSAAGTLAFARGDMDSPAEVLFTECLDLARAMGDRQLIAYAFVRLGAISRSRGDETRAQQLYEESLSLSREVDDPRGIAEALFYLGHVVLEQGDPMTARTMFHEALAMAQDAADQLGIAQAHEGLGRVARVAGNDAEAAMHWERSLADYTEMELRVGIATRQHDLGRLDGRRGNLVSARLRHTTGLKLAMESGFLWVVPMFLEDFAILAATQRRPVHALRLAGASAAFRKRENIRPEPPDARELHDVLDQVRREIDEPAAAAAYASGQAMTLEAAIAEALMENA